MLAPRSHPARSALRFLPLLSLLLALGLPACAATNTHPDPTPTPTLIPIQTPVDIGGAIIPSGTPVPGVRRYTTTIQPDVAYGPEPEETLDLCLPQGAQGLRPGVVLIHGGGWSQGDKTHFSALCAALASYGFVAATINYRLAPAHVWPAQLVDAQLVARYLRSRASQLALDPARLCSYGDSAGGHLAVFLGVLPSIHPGDHAALLADQSPGASCVVDDFSPVDLTRLADAPSLRFLAQQLLGGATPQSDPTAYRDASPLFRVSTRSAPTMIVQGNADTIVPPAQSRALQQALTQAGITVRYVSYDGGHSFSGLTPEQAAALTDQTLAFLIAQEQP
jgi:acetyl esterase/lipase